MNRLKTKKKPVAKTFNVMVAGHSRIGKSAYIHTLFDTLQVQKLVPIVESASPLPQGDLTKPTHAPAWIECLDHFGQRMMLGLVDTPGLDIPAGVHRIASDEQLSLNAEKYAQQLLDFIENAFEDTLLSESKIVRDRTALDRQVHCMLYLINPDIILSCKGLSFMDKIVLEKMQKRVNVIPCIGKSDLVTVRDLKTIRQYLKNDLLQNDIHVYNFEPEEDENGELVDLNDKLPFCLVNSEMLDDGQGLPMMGVQKGDQMILGREYIWGVVECENPNHCDFTLLKDLLFGGYMDDLRQETNQILYEQWRTERLSARRESIAVPASIKDKMRLEE